MMVIMKKRRITIFVRLFLLLFLIGVTRLIAPFLGATAEWVSVAIIPYLFLGVLVVLAVVGLRPAAQRRRIASFRAKQGLCLGCGYDLRGHSSGQRCPECGSQIAGHPA
jgi:hypothetical protein